MPCLRASDPILSSLLAAVMAEQETKMTEHFGYGLT